MEKQRYIAGLTANDRAVATLEANRIQEKEEAVMVPLRHSEKELIKYIWCVRHPWTAEPTRSTLWFPLPSHIVRETRHFTLTAVNTTSAVSGYCLGVIWGPPEQRNWVTRAQNYNIPTVPFVSDPGFYNIANQNGTSVDVGTAALASYYQNSGANTGNGLINRTMTDLTGAFYEDMPSATASQVNDEATVFRVCAMGMRFFFNSPANTRIGKLTMLENVGHDVIDGPNLTLDEMVTKTYRTTTASGVIHGGKFSGAREYPLVGSAEFHQVWHPHVCADAQWRGLSQNNPNGDILQNTSGSENISYAGSRIQSAKATITGHSAHCLMLASNLVAGETCTFEFTYVYEYQDRIGTSSEFGMHHMGTSNALGQCVQQYASGAASHVGSSGASNTATVAARSAL